MRGFSRHPRPRLSAPRGLSNGSGISSIRARMLELWDPTRGYQPCGAMIACLQSSPTKVCQNKQSVLLFIIACCSYNKTPTMRERRGVGGYRVNGNLGGKRTNFGRDNSGVRFVCLYCQTMQEEYQAWNKIRWDALGWENRAGNKIGRGNFVWGIIGWENFGQDTLGPYTGPTLHVQT